MARGEGGAEGIVINPRETPLPDSRHLTSALIKPTKSKAANPLLTVTTLSLYLMHCLGLRPAVALVKPSSSQNPPQKTSRDASQRLGSGTGTGKERHSGGFSYGVQSKGRIVPDVNKRYSYRTRAKVRLTEKPAFIYR